MMLYSMNRLTDDEHLVQAKEIYDAELQEIDDAIKHSSVCQLEYCEIKLNYLRAISPVCGIYYLVMY
jgi:hypothetical protein